MRKSELFYLHMFTEENFEHYMLGSNKDTVIGNLNNTLRCFLCDGMTKSEVYLVKLHVKWAYENYFYAPAVDGNHWKYTFLNIDEEKEFIMYDLNPAGIKYWLDRGLFLSEMNVY